VKTIALKLSKEIKTAVLVISGILLFIFIFNYLKGENVFDSSKKISAIYENVEGLAPSAAVTINGHTIGKVQSIEFKGDGSGLLRVTMLISDDFPFSVNSEAQLYEAGLIGGKAIAIIPSFDSSALVQSGDVLRSKVKPGLTDLVNQRLTPLQEKIEKMMVSADQLLINLNEVFDVQSKENIKLSIAELSTTISSFKTTSESLNSLVEDNKPAIGETILNFSKISKDLSSVSESLSESDIDLIMLDLKSTISSFDLLLKNIENGDGSFGKFIKDDRLYVNLQGATKQLEELLNDMKLNPKRYVHFSLFGKKAQQYDVDGKKVKTTED
jgi:phospholipid/cholesterol/gamma-HCH transport system substrate-binding protein|tara:strand:- start:4337 stop:5317 length:981 start_codon:yes stop_codon:yes gene_type:complete